MNTTWFSFLKRIGKERKKKTKFCQASWFEGDLNHEGKANQMLFEISHWEENFAQLQSIIFFAFTFWWVLEGTFMKLFSVRFSNLFPFIVHPCDVGKSIDKSNWFWAQFFFFFCIYGFLRIWSVFIPQKPDMIYVDVMGFFSGLLYVIFANEFPMSCWLNKKWKQEKYSRFCKRGTYRGSHLPWRGNRRIRHRASDHQCIDIDLWNQVRDKQIVPFGLPSVGILKCKPKSVGTPGLYSSTVLYSSKAHIHSFFWAFHEAL